jgi:tetratricopeptide (TPR) repeat protein
MFDYQDFEVEIDSKTSASGVPQYFGRVIKSPAGEAPACPVAFSFSAPDALAKLRADLRSAVLEYDEKSIHGLSSRSEGVLRDFGREVFRSIFVDAPQIRDIYARSKGPANDLRIKLRIESPELAGLPWEYLYEDNEIPSFVSLRLPVVRYLATAGAPGRMGVKGPLRILGMISDPATDEWPKLDVAKERERINKGLDRLQHDGRIDFQWVSGGTGMDLINKLQEDEWHIFHFIGHGGIEQSTAPAGGAGGGFTESGFIVMVDEDGAPVKKFASDLAVMLSGARKSLRLIVLNCCDSATTENVGEKFGNPAIGLMRTGWLPAVVAMQFPISDAAAIRMSEGFYRALANNRPIDDAITNARRLIQDRSRVEWGIPVLYMRSPDGKIFDIDNPMPQSNGKGASPRLSEEQLQQRRTEFLLAAAPPRSIAELEQLAQLGRDMHATFKNDPEVAERLAKIYVALGDLQQRAKQVPKAAASFAFALTLAPSKAEYRVRRANFNALVGFFENALADMAEAIKLQPDNAEFRWIRGVICTLASGPENKQGFLEQSVNSFTAAIEMKPGEPKYLVSRANALAQLKRVDEALADMDKAIALSPDNVDFMSQRAKIEAQRTWPASASASTDPARPAPRDYRHDGNSPHGPE